jgi:hypothetical protein
LLTGKKDLRPVEIFTGLGREAGLRARFPSLIWRARPNRLAASVGCPTQEISGNVSGIRGPRPPYPLSEIVHQVALQERALSKVFPLPQAEAICEIELLFVIAPLEILIADIAIVQYARPSLPDVSADVH